MNESHSGEISPMGEATAIDEVINYAKRWSTLDGATRVHCVLITAAMHRSRLVAQPQKFAGLLITCERSALPCA